MSKFFRNLVVVSALVGLLIAPNLATGSTSAVDIFNNCTKGGLTDKASCSDCEGLAKNTDVCKDVKHQGGSPSNPIITIIKAAIDVVSKIVGIAAIISIIVSGIRFTVANGDSQSIATARTGLIYALIGIAVTVLSQAIVLFALKDVK